MRIALVSPYSWTYPGGVTRHIEALAERFIEDGHHVRVLAPFDPPDRFSTVLHRGARPQRIERARLPRLARAARSASRPTARSRTCRSRRTASPPCSASCAPAATTSSTSTSRSRPMLGWVGADSTRLPLVGTFHSTQNKRLRTGSPTCSARGACSTACTSGSPSPRPPPGRGRRWFGGHYRVIPNGVHVDPERATLAALRPGRATSCGSCSSARRSSARACRCCCARSRRCASTSRPS